MDLVEYQKAATQFAVFPQSIALEYLVYGLAGEAGELSEKFADFFTESTLQWGEFVSNLIAEAGDVCWYAAALATELGINLDSLSYEHSAEVHSFMASVPYAVAFANLPANSYKKVLRGDKALGLAKLEMVIHLGKLMWALRQMAKNLDISFESILESNVRKLTVRQQSGKIGGDGDNR